MPARPALYPQTRDGHGGDMLQQEIYIEFELRRLEQERNEACFQHREDWLARQREIQVARRPALALWPASSTSSTLA